MVTPVATGRLVAFHRADSAPSDEAHSGLPAAASLLVPASMKNEEVALIQRMRAGDTRAFETIFRTYFGPLCVIASRYAGSSSAAEEVVEDVFVRLWELRERLDVRDSLKSYLRAAVRNRALNYSRNERARVQALYRRSPDEVLPGMAQQRPTPDDEVHLHDLCRAVEQAINELPPRTRQVFTMSRQRGLTCAEIGAALSISPKTVENLLGRALKNLRAHLAPFRNT